MWFEIALELCHTDLSFRDFAEGGAVGGFATCRFCHSQLEMSFVDLGMSPLANSYVPRSQARAMEAFFPLHAYVCTQCWLVQLEVYETSENIFSEYAYFSSFSESWLAHVKAYTDAMTKRLDLNKNALVVEIASNDGYLLQFFQKTGIPVLGVEPAQNVANYAIAKGIPTRVEFFGDAGAKRMVAEGHKADLLVGNNVLAHVPDLNGFVCGLKTLLKPEGIITMEFPHLQQLIEQCQFDTIYHEHLSYFSFCTVERIFAQHGLTIFDVEELPTHGGSLRIYCSHPANNSYPVLESVRVLRQREQALGYEKSDLYTQFAERVRAIKRDLLEFMISAKRAGKSIVGYGAAAKANTLLNYCGISTDMIDYTVDLNPHKRDHLMPGTRIPIYAPDRVAETKPDYLFILPWNIRDEVMKQMAHIQAWGGRFVIPIPSVQVL